MPTYEYRCEKCGKEFEQIQKITEEALKCCPDRACKGKVFRMINGGGGFILKGTGWYATDYKKKSGESASPHSSTSSASKPESKSDSGGTTKSDSPKKS